jgi:hypothetical protein
MKEVGTMRSMNQRQQTAAPLVGIALLMVGVGALALRPLGLDLGSFGGTSGWPLLVIVPGLILMASAIVPAPPNGVGLAIGGSIVTTVGLLLLYQQSTGNWATWAYAWALLPGAAGVAMTVYGSATRRPSLRAVGVRLAVIAALMFGVGLWFFESVFATGRAPFDMSGWWPVVPIIAGLALIGRDLWRSSAGPSPAAGVGDEKGSPS